MERFSQSLSKNRNSAGTNNKPLPESPVCPAGDWSALDKEDGIQSNYVQSQNPYYNINSSFNSDYDVGQSVHSDGEIYQIKLFLKLKRIL